MRPITFFTLMIMTILGLIVMDKIPLVVDAITSTGYSAAEVISGIGTILIVFYIMAFVLTWRG